ncbi:MAG: helix-turn-helix domain-containing protein, partial [Ruminococcus sp.]
MEYTEHQKMLLQKADALQREKKLSQNGLGELLGISGSALSQVRNGKYQANPQQIFDTLESYFATKEQSSLTYQEISYA